MKTIPIFLLLYLGSASVLGAQQEGDAATSNSAAPLAGVFAPLPSSVDARLLVTAEVKPAEPSFEPLRLRPNRPRSALRGAVIGGLVTGTAAVVGGLISTGGNCDDNLCLVYYPWLFSVATVPGVVIGGLVGWNLPDDEKPASTEPAPQSPR